MMVEADNLMWDIIVIITLTLCPLNVARSRGLLTLNSVLYNPATGKWDIQTALPKFNATLTPCNIIPVLNFSIIRFLLVLQKFSTLYVLSLISYVLCLLLFILSLAFIVNYDVTMYVPDYIVNLINFIEETLKYELLWTVPTAVWSSFSL